MGVRAYSLIMKQLDGTNSDVTRVIGAPGKML